MMTIAPNSRTHQGKKERGEVKGEYGGVCGEEEGNVRFENAGSVFGRHPAREYTRCRRSSTLIDALPSEHPFSRLIRHAGIRWAYSTSHPQREDD